MLLLGWTRLVSVATILVIASATMAPGAKAATPAVVAASSCSLTTSQYLTTDTEAYLHFRIAGCSGATYGYYAVYVDGDGLGLGNTVLGGVLVDTDYQDSFDPGPHTLQVVGVESDGYQFRPIDPAAVIWTTTFTVTTSNSSISCTVTGTQAGNGDNNSAPMRIVVRDCARTGNVTSLVITAENAIQDPYPVYEGPYKTGVVVDTTVSLPNAAETIRVTALPASISKTYQINTPIAGPDCAYSATGKSYSDRPGLLKFSGVSCTGDHLLFVFTGPGGVSRVLWDGPPTDAMQIPDQVLPYVGDYHLTITGVGWQGAVRGDWTFTSPMGPAVPKPAPTPTPITRLAGASRYETSAAISAASFAAHVPVLYIASGANFPDALSGASVAGRDGAPLLLVTATSIPSAIQVEINRLQPGRIVILGGTSVVSTQVAARLAATAPITRLAGASRYETSAAISAASFAAHVPVLYIASGANFPDALSGASVAGRDGAPLLLVTATSIPSAIQVEINRLQPGRIVILGGTSVVSTQVAARLAATAPITRLAGASRYETSAAISAASFAAHVPVLYIASGANFPDALSGASVAGRDGAPLLLVTATSIPSAIQVEINRLQPGRIVILGGTSVVSTQVAARLAE